MGNLWGWSSCVGYMVLAALASSTRAAYDDTYQIHLLEKNHDFIRHPKRDASCQLSGWSLCPDSVDGGCCPEGYSCAVSYCYATTAGPTSACGSEGYYNCPLTAGPAACCPVGYLCNREGCAPPAGVSIAQTCSQSYFACTSSPFGCCPNGMVCGVSTCYHAPETFQVSGTVTTTDSEGDTITTIVTSTTVITPGLDSTDTSATNAGAAKLFPSTVSKMPAITDSSSSSSSSDDGGGSGDDSGNLSQAQLGGIIGGAIAILIIIVIVATVVLWRLKRTEKAAQAAAESRHETSSGQPRSQKSAFGQFSISEVDGTDVDSILRSRNAHFRTRSDSPTAGDRSRSETPNLYGSNASSPPPQGRSTVIAQLPTSDVSHSRQSSMDSYGAGHDHVPFAQRPSVDSQGSHAYTHTRQWSNASELEGSVGGAHGVSELDNPDAVEEARRRSSSATRAPKGQVRRTGEPAGSNSVRGGRGDSAAAASMPLGPLPEFGELHGHYGPSDQTVGQTAAKLHGNDSSINLAPEKDG